jgi:PPK2 family polyphosphate:nucleotide phosphotransferase
MNENKLTRRLLVEPNKKVSLRKDFDPAFVPAHFDKESAEALLADGVHRLAAYQDKLYAQDTFALLVVLQAMDAAGKDSIIKHVMSGVNPQGCQVSSFKAPSTEELNHDYLWRCYKALPERGRIGIFNRSYYEDVLIARVHPEVLDREKLPPESKGKGIWKRRFQEINNFEQYLTENGIIVLKFFLNVSKKEQRDRFLARIETPEKNWKFSAGDLQERAFWNDYQKAFEEVFRHTSTKVAPWHIIPADSKPFARLAVTAVINHKLESLKLSYPKVGPEQKKLLAKSKEMLEAEK